MLDYPLQLKDGWLKQQDFNPSNDMVVCKVNRDSQYCRDKFLSDGE